MLMRSQTVEDKNKNRQKMRQDQVEHNQFKTIFFGYGIYSLSLCLQTKDSIMRQIVFATENGIIDFPEGHSIKLYHCAVR